MGVYIKGMEMPTSCYDCPMTNDGFYLCKAAGPYKELEDDCEECRPQWCPLVPVQPHGRLIDADALVMENYTQYGAIDDLALEAIKAAPTIIPAEEDE